MLEDTTVLARRSASQSSTDVRTTYSAHNDGRSGVSFDGAHVRPRESIPLEIEEVAVEANPVNATVSIAPIDITESNSERNEHGKGKPTDEK